MERGAGDCWAPTAIDADSKVIISHTLGDRGGGPAYASLQDVARVSETGVSERQTGIVYTWVVVRQRLDEIAIVDLIASFALFRAVKTERV
jgi:hypothetical protein